MLDKYDAIRAKYKVNTDAINLEITESVSFNEVPSVKELINSFREKGYHFSLDDFGTGYSNLVGLFSCDYRNIKIDKSLLWEAEANHKTDKLLQRLTELINNLGYNVIQEGVETKEQLDKVLGYGCDMIQGFYFSKPMPGKDFINFVKREKLLKKY